MSDALCTIFMIVLTLWNSEQKNGLLINFFVFHPILMKLDEIVLHMGNYHFTKFHQNQMKNKKVLLIACFSVQNFKVSEESWKLYIVLLLTSQNATTSKLLVLHRYLSNSCTANFFYGINEVETRSGLCNFFKESTKHAQ